MKTFLAIYTGSPEGMEAWRALDDATRAAREREGMAAWKQWIAANEKSLVDSGTPLGKTKRVTRDGIEDVRNAIAAYSVVRAETHEDAARLFQGHPHFTVFPGDGIEVMPCLEIPGG
jgi:hypothetical protein